jgi:hypothetical protein
MIRAAEFQHGPGGAKPAEELALTVINGATLTTFDISLDGSLIKINVTDEDSKPGSLVLPVECLQELIMSLPEMFQQALRRRYHDCSFRLVYPLGGWRLEASTEPGKLILTLSTSDGFSVSFAATADELEQFADAAKRTPRVRVLPPN